MTGRIEIDLFSTLDGVMQAPGGPEEDPAGGFAFGGWQAPVMDQAVGDQVLAGMGRMDALLLGRRTYDIFAAYWPEQTEEGPEGEIARTLNALPKYVASRGEPELSWEGSNQVGGPGADLVAEIAGLRERHREIHVIGSVDFARTLLAEGLFDRLNLWVYPIVLGAGKRLFPPEGPATELELLAPAESTANGVLMLHYGPTGRVPATGDMT